MYRAVHLGFPLSTADVPICLDSTRFLCFVLVCFNATIAPLSKTYAPATVHVSSAVE